MSVSGCALFHGALAGIPLPYASRLHPGLFASTQRVGEAVTLSFGAGPDRKPTIEWSWSV